MNLFLQFIALISYFLIKSVVVNGQEVGQFSYECVLRRGCPVCLVRCLLVLDCNLEDCRWGRTTVSQECEKCLLQGKCNSCLLEAITFGGYPTLECMHEGEGCDECITVCELEHDVSFFLCTHMHSDLY